MNTIGVVVVTSKVIEHPARHIVLPLSIPVFVMIFAVIGWVVIVWTGGGPLEIRVLSAVSVVEWPAFVDVCVHRQVMAC